MNSCRNALTGISVFQTPCKHVGCGGRGQGRNALTGISVFQTEANRRPRVSASRRCLGRNALTGISVFQTS